MSRRLVPLLLAGAVGVALVAPADAAGAAALRAPARPHGEHVVAVGRHTVVVALPRVARARSYRLYVSTRRSDLTVARIAHAHRSRARTTPRLTVGRLPFTTARYWFRVSVRTGAKIRYGSHVGAVTLRPAAPTSARVTATPTSTSLRWTARAGYQRTVVQQATTPRFSGAVRSYGVRGTTGVLTPYGLTRGRTYWFRVRTMNGATPSAWSAATHAVVRGRLQPVRLLTYNVLTSKTDGTVTTGERIAPWSQRRAGVLSLVRRAAPDVLALQEGGGWVGQPQAYGGRRQVDDLLASLPGYRLARTETPPAEHHYQRFGNYVLYRAAAYAELGTRGVWQLGEGRTAAYQLLAHRGTGARLLAVSVHLNYGAGRVADDQRAAETRRLLAAAGAAARRAGAAVVYAGDFNSTLNRNHAYDGPGVVMRAAGVVDARAVASSLGNDAFNSANLYLRTPPRVAQSIDYVYAPPGFAVSSRSVLLDLVGTRLRGVIPSDHNPVLVTGAFGY